MSEIKVVAETDYLQRLARNVRHGLAELVWNAFDADATHVTVQLKLNDLGGVDSFSVIDDGTGIDGENVSEYFGRLGGSWKKQTAHTATGRTLHGQKGQGRFAAFALGNTVTWDTTYFNKQSSHFSRILLSGTGVASNRFEIVGNLPASNQSGTKVTVTNVSEKASIYLQDSQSVCSDLAMEFAPYLAAYKVSLAFEDRQIDSSKMASVTKRKIEFISAQTKNELQLEIWEWDRPVDRRLYLCNESGIPIYDLAPGIQAPGSNFTAYAEWRGFAERREMLELEDLAESPIPEALQAIRNELTSFFQERRNRQNTRLIESWKQEGLYPFADVPKDEITPAEQAQRHVFDLVAVTAKSAINDKEKAATKLTLRLLRSAIDTNPKSVRKILGEVIALNQQEADDLASLLEKTTLGGMIASTKLIADRLEFLSALRAIVAPGKLKKQLKERSQLQKILLGETWIFGEEYALIGSDQALLTVLREHRDLLDDNIRIDDQKTVQSLQEPVNDADNRTVIPDLMFSSVIPQSDEKRRHLVIELKRPSVSIGHKEAEQILNYAMTVTKDDRFDKENTSWDFWIIGDEIEDGPKRLLTSVGTRKNIYRNFENTFVQCVTWGEIIQQAEYRMKFLKNKLDYDPDSNVGIHYLNKKYSEYLPIDFRENV